MRTIGGALQTHLNGSTTTMTTCWKITRRDGEVFRYTALDVDLVVAGDTYTAHKGGNASAVEFKLKMNVNNLDLSGFFDDDEISEEALIAGLFRSAEVEIFAVNWADTSQGIIKLMYGRIAIITRIGHAFTAEVRSLAQSLGQNVGSLVSYSCRADFGSTGSGPASGCNYPINPQTWAATTLYGSAAIAGGSGAVVIAGPNGHGLWDAGWNEDIDHMNIVLITGGANYSQPRITARFTIGVVNYVFVASQVPVSGGAITNGFYPLGIIMPLTQEGQKPYPGDVVWTVEDGTTGVAVHVSPTVPNGFQYLLTNPGTTSGGSEPTWPTVLGGTVTDGTCIWEAVLGVNRPGTVVSSANRKTFVVTGVPGDLAYGTGGTNFGGYFAGGKVTFTSGANDGVTVDIDGFNETGSDWTVTLFEPAPFDIVAAVTVLLSEGCDHQPATCKRRNNLVNYRGETFVPGNDVLFRVNTNI